MTLPGPAEIAAAPVHAVIRDFPEALAVFRRFGVDVTARGGEAVAASLDGDAAPLLTALTDAIAWRADHRGRCPPPRS